MLNQISMIGRLTRDPELRKVGETPVCSFRIACDRDFKNKGGEVETDFVDVVAWRQRAEFVSKYFSKGQLAVVSGRLQIRDWTDKDGNKRSSTEINAEHVYFGDSKPKSNEAGNAASGDTPAYNAPPDGFIPDFDEGDGELPF